MAVTRPGPARVSVHYSQYYVVGGPALDPAGDVGGDLIPGLLIRIGPREFGVITGLHTGKITVMARPLPAPPPELEPGWDVAGEVDLQSLDGQIWVADWEGSGHPELGPLAIAGAGRYRLRVHARQRDGGRSEEHLLLAWPSAEPAPAQLLTPLDACGLEYAGQVEVPPPDDIDQAAATVIRDLAALLARPEPPAWSGRRTAIQVQAVVPGTPRQVWDAISDPKWWLGTGGTGSLEDGGFFIASIALSPDLHAEGTFLAHERLKRLVLTWSWFTYREAEGEHEEVADYRADPVAGQTTKVTRIVRSPGLAQSWPLPADGPTVIEIRLHGDRRGNTDVAIEHRDLPEELAEPMRALWAWALRALLPWLTDTPRYLAPWQDFR